MSPCRDCEKREPGCHARCEDYIAWKEDLTTINKAESEARSRDKYDPRKAIMKTWVQNKVAKERKR